MTTSGNKLGKKGFKIGKQTLKVTMLIFTIVFALLLVASAWGGHINPNTFTFLSFLTLGLPILLIVNLLIMIMWLIVWRWRFALISLAAIILSWGGIRTVFPINIISHADKAKQNNSLRVLTFNVMNFGPYNPNNHKPSMSMRYILDQDADVVLLQEGSQERNYLKLSNTEMMAAELEKKYPYHSNGRHDLLILSKYPYTVVKDTSLKNGPESIKSNDGEYQYYARSYDLELPNGKQLRIVNLHLHSTGLADEDKELYLKITNNDLGSKEDFRNVKHSLYNKLSITFLFHAHESKVIRDFLDRSPKNIILCGDFNDTPASYCYRTILGDDMSDAFVDCGLGIKPTFHDNRMYFKIDHIMYRGNLEAVDWHRDKLGDSDHYPQVATFIWK